MPENLTLNCTCCGGGPGACLCGLQYYYYPQMTFTILPGDVCAVVPVDGTYVLNIAGPGCFGNACCVYSGQFDQILWRLYYDPNFHAACGSGGSFGWLLEMTLTSGAGTQHLLYSNESPVLSGPGPQAFTLCSATGCTGVPTTIMVSGVGASTYCCKFCANLPTTLYLTNLTMACIFIPQFGFPIATYCPCAAPGNPATVALIYDPTSQTWSGTGQFGTCGHNWSFVLSCVIQNSGDYTPQLQVIFDDCQDVNTQSADPVTVTGFFCFGSNVTIKSCSPLDIHFTAGINLIFPPYLYNSGCCPGFSCTGGPFPQDFSEVQWSMDVTD